MYKAIYFKKLIITITLLILLPILISIIFKYEWKNVISNFALYCMIVGVLGLFRMDSSAIFSGTFELGSGENQSKSQRNNQTSARAVEFQTSRDGSSKKSYKYRPISNGMLIIGIIYTVITFYYYKR